VDVCAIRLGSAEIDPRYLMRALNSPVVRAQIIALQSGSTRKRISRKNLATVPIPIPPLNEQRRIVERVEALFEEIDRGVESLRAAKNAVALYRQSLLKSAFEGSLTADWRAQNPDRLESPDALLARIRGEREARYRAAVDDWERAIAAWRKDSRKDRKPSKLKRPRTIPVDPTDNGIPGWATIPLGLAIADPIYGTSKKCGYGLGATSVLRIPNIGSGRIDSTDLKSADFDKVEFEKFSLREGDVLTIRSNGSLPIVGRPAIVMQQHTGFLFAGYLIRLRPISEILLSRYLIHLMIEPNVRAQIEAKAKSTSGVNNISAKELQELNIPICSPAEQAEVVRILDARLEAAELLDGEIDTNLARADALRQSILKRAFAGQLVPQHPDEEPASALLERIRAERAETPGKRRKARVGV
ncbi:MAG: restriction endonuclease subunit S, partial [Chloroflexi bacterium]|nr:restriction endonuclease subunit S [Chloroflexota bacterium]